MSQLFEEPIVTDMEGRVKALEESLQAALAEVTKLTTVTDTQQDKMKALTDELAKVTPPPPPLKSEATGGAVAGPPGPVFAGGEKVALPQKFDGSTNLMSYLVQFNVMAVEQAWGEAKKGIVLLGRLKGRALDVAAQGEDHSYAALVERLKRHFVPDNEDMYAQQMQAIKKQESQTWEDLAFQTRELAKKAYKTANAPTQERLAISAFVDAIQDDKLRQKLRDSELSTMEQVLQRIRKLEADQEIELQRSAGKKAVRAVQQQEKGEAVVAQPRTSSGNKARRGGGSGRGARGRRGFGRSWPRGQGRGRGIGPGPAKPCYFCEATDHFMRNCPHKRRWLDQQKHQPYYVTAGGANFPTTGATSYAAPASNSFQSSTPSHLN